MFFENNVVVGIPDDAVDPEVRYSAINFLIPGRNREGKGAYLDGNIFWDIPRRIFDHVDESLSGEPVTTDLQMHNSLLPPERSSDVIAARPGTIMDLGERNISGDPRFVAPDADFRLRPGSPALGAGTNGLDMGAYVPEGASISGEPYEVSYRTDAVLTVGGPGITHYKYRVNDGDWSDESTIETPINLTGLVDKQYYTVYVLGRNFAGVWQREDEAGASQTWLVNQSHWRLVINEILARNLQAVKHEGTTPNLIELYYDGAAPLDMSGMSISDDGNDPRKFIFPTGTNIDPGEYLVLYADANTATSGIHLGFALDGDGEGVYLYDKAGMLLDSVEFGLQIIDWSIGRIDRAGPWTLTLPSFGKANTAAPLGDSATLQINEWFSDGKVVFEDDFIELYNPDLLPVPLAGLYLTDDPVARPGKHQIGPLNFIAGKGFVVFQADDSSRSGHVNFKLSANGEIPALLDAEFNEIDKVIYGPQTTDASQGRSPDGAEHFEFFRLPTPGLENPLEGEIIVTCLIAIDDEWSYNQSGADLDEAWREPNYIDTDWPTGAALLYVENSDLPAPKNSPLTLGVTTYYFRRHFNLEVEPADATFQMSTVIDDGALFYINGVEVFRLGMQGQLGEDNINFDTFANRSVGNATYEGPFSIQPDYFQRGDNVIAVEVHQNSAGSSDIVFGLELEATVSSPDESYADDLAVLDGLRITEIMYHPAEGGDFEFIEFQNISAAALDLSGVRLTEGIEFTFPVSTMITPSGYLLVVKAPAVFAEKYPEVPPEIILGPYDGRLSNGGEHILLKLARPLEAAVLRFDYNDTWYPSADGGGYALVIKDPTAAPVSWDKAESWKAGTEAGGSPGRAEDELP